MITKTFPKFVLSKAAFKVAAARATVLAKHAKHAGARRQRLARAYATGFDEAARTLPHHAARAIHGKRPIVGLTYTQREVLLDRAFQQEMEKSAWERSVRPDISAWNARESMEHFLRMRGAYTCPVCNRQHMMADAVPVLDPDFVPDLDADFDLPELIDVCPDCYLTHK